MLPDITFIDFETTGSVKGYDNLPWQIGMVTLRDGELVPGSEFSSLLRVPCDHPFNVYAPGRWASQREQMAGAPTLPELWEQIGARLTGFALGAHNLGTERTIISTAYPLQQFGPWVDTLKIARKAIPELKNYKLQTVIENIGASEVLHRRYSELDFHDALFDAAASAYFLAWLQQYPGWDNISIEQLSAYK